MGPHVSAVIADENREVANDANTDFAAVGAQGAPLLGEGELQEALLLKLVMQLLAQLGHRFRMAANDLFRPAIPRLVTKTLAQGAKQHIILEPPMVLAAEVLVAFASWT